MIRCVVLISGFGSNLQALLDATSQPGSRARIVAVISNNPAAPGLQRAAKAGVDTVVIAPEDHPDRASYDAVLMAAIDQFSADLVLLAGFMRILGQDFVQHYTGRLLNIHPSLLPAYKGLNTHARVLAAGITSHGASVHYVNEELDSGAVILQASVPVLPDDDEARLGQRVLEKEHIIYPLVINWIAEGRLVYRDSGPSFDGQPLEAPLQLDQL